MSFDMFIVIFYCTVFSDLHCQKDPQMNVNKQNVSCVQFETDSLSSVQHSSAKVKKMCLESRLNKHTHRSQKTNSGEICLNSKWITDVDRIHVTKEKRKQMMKKAQAISRAISKQAASAKNSVPATPSSEQSPAVCLSASKSMMSQKDAIQSAGKTDAKSNDGAKFRWRIPRVQNVQTVPGSNGAVGNQPPSLTSKIVPPLSKGVSSRFGWQRRGHSSSRSGKFGGEIQHCPFASLQVLDNIPETTTVTVSPVQSVKSSQRVASDVVAEKTADGVREGGTSDVPGEMPQAVANPLSCHDSSSNLLHIFSQELVKKFPQLSTETSTIFLQNAQPADREHDSVVSILVPPQKNLNLNSSTAQCESPAKISSTQHSESVVVNASILSPSAAKKRKLNILQYKSILPQRQKVMPHSAAITLPAEFPTVRSYGHCEDILHDHDYVANVKCGSECIEEMSIEQTSVLHRNVIGKEDVTVTERISEGTVTASSVTESARDVTVRETVADVSVTESMSRSVASCVISSQLIPVASVAFEGGPESEFATNKNSASTCSGGDETIDRVPAYFDVISLPNRQTKISVSADTLVTKKKLNPQSHVIIGGHDSTKQLSKEPSEKLQSCETDVGRCVESCTSVNPQVDLQTITVTINNHSSSRSSSVSSAISISSDEEPSRSRSRSSHRHYSSSVCSYSSDSRSENFAISFYFHFVVFNCLYWSFFNCLNIY